MFVNVTKKKAKLMLISDIVKVKTKIIKLGKKY